MHTCIGFQTIKCITAIRPLVSATDVMNGCFHLAVALTYTEDRIASENDRLLLFSLSDVEETSYPEAERYDSVVASAL